MSEPANEEEGMSRKTFLGWAAAGLGGLIGLTLGGAGTGYVLSPAFQKKDEDWVDIGPAKAIKPGKPTKVDFVVRKRDAWTTSEKRSSAWVMTGDGEHFMVYDPRCTHLGCPYRWDDARKQFLCPCHSAVFDVDGQVVSGPPPRPLDRYQTKVVGGRLLILPQAIRGKA